MDYWDVTKLLFRRWYIAVPLLLVTVAVTAYIAMVVKPDYQLTSYVQLIPAATSPDTSAAAPQNPWNQLGLDALAQAGDYATLDQTFLDTLKKGGYSTNISIIASEPPAGITIQVVATSRATADSTTVLTIERFEQKVRDLQTSYGIRSRDLITTTRLDAGENLKRPGGKVKRAILAVAGTGVLVTGAVTIMFDSLLRRRRRRGAERERLAIQAAPAAPSLAESVAAARTPATGRAGARPQDPIVMGQYQGKLAPLTPVEPAWPVSPAPAPPPGPTGAGGTHRSEDAALVFGAPPDATIVLPAAIDPQRFGSAERKKD